jgi:hypothetical protein
MSVLALDERRLRVFAPPRHKKLLAMDSFAEGRLKPQGMIGRIAFTLADV